MKDKIRLGFLGAGGWGRQNHLPALRLIKERNLGPCQLEIAALCEAKPDVLKTVGDEYGIAKRYTNVEEFAADKDIDAYAVVINPIYLEDVLKVLMRRKVPIFSEKPSGPDYETAKRLATLVQVPNVVAYNRRYFPLNQQFKKLVDETEGIYYVSCNFYRYERYDSHRAELTPFIIGTAVHTVNLFEHYFGPIRDCQTEVLKVPSNNTKFWKVNVNMESGLRACMDVLPCTGSMTEWMEVHSQQRSLYLRNCQWGTIDAPGEIIVHERGKLVDVIRGDKDQPIAITGGFVGEYLDFFQAALTGSPTLSNFQNSAETMRFSEAIESTMAE
jgi:predicted dehydrogenase